MGAAVNGNGRYGPVVIFTFGVHKVQRTIPKICLFHLSFCIVGRWPGPGFTIQNLPDELRLQS